MLRTPLKIGVRRVKFGMEEEYPYETHMMYFLSGNKSNLTVM